VNPNGNGYLIQVVGDTGARNTMLGFMSRKEAEVWVATDQARGKINQGADLAIPEPM